MILSVIQLDEAQLTWVESENLTTDKNAVPCDYTDINDVEYNDCIDAVVLTATGYEAWATYFSGATVTEIDIPSPF